MSRRDVMAGATACAALGTMADPAGARPDRIDRPVMANVAVTVNGQKRELDLDTCTSPLGATREDLDALVSLDAVIRKDGIGKVAFGGVAPRPWRVEAAEADLPRDGKAVADRAFARARPTAENAIKLRLAERMLDAVLSEARG